MDTIIAFYFSTHDRNDLAVFILRFIYEQNENIMQLGVVFWSRTKYAFGIFLYFFYLQTCILKKLLFYIRYLYLEAVGMVFIIPRRRCGYVEIKNIPDYEFVEC